MRLDGNSLEWLTVRLNGSRGRVNGVMKPLNLLLDGILVLVGDVQFGARGSTPSS